jgi:hypothetical protein
MRLICTALVLLCLFGLSAGEAAAQSGAYYPDVTQDTPLSEAELTDVFTGQTHRGTYNFMRREIPTFAFTETTRENGRAHHVQGERVDDGDWAIYGNRICFTYDTLDFQGSCFHIFQVGNCYYHYSLRADENGRGRFTARSVIKGERPNCEPSFS